MELFQKIAGWISFSIILLFSLVFGLEAHAKNVLSQYTANNYVITYSEESPDLNKGQMPRQFINISKKGVSLANLEGMNIKFEIINSTSSQPPYLVTTTYSGGAHCCSNFVIYALDNELEKITLPEKFLPPQYEQHQFFSWNKPGKDVKDSSTILLIKTRDPFWHYWHTYYADMSAPLVIWAFNGEKLKLATDEIKKHAHPDGQYIKEADALKHNARYWNDFIDKKKANKTKPALAKEISYPGEITAIVLELLYAGRPNLARNFIDRAWNSDYPYKKEFIQNLNHDLDKSHYWQALRARGYQKIGE